MSNSVALAADHSGPVAPSPLPDTFLGCYEIANRDDLAWAVRLYSARRDGGDQSHAELGDAKQAIWDLRRKNAGSCRGYGFVVPVDEEMIAVSSGWHLPDATEGEYRVSFESEFTTDPTNPRHRAVISGILREGVKAHFKKHRSTALGDLWQDFDRFCQMPKPPGSEEYCFCRKFSAAAKVLSGDRWVLQPLISTSSLDGRTFADYYRAGEVRQLTEMIEAKRVNRLNRRNRPTAVRVFRDESTNHVAHVGVMELVEPNLLEGIASLSRHDQAARATGTIRCCEFNKPPVEVPLAAIRLVLDTQITQGNHSETILDPADRIYLSGSIRDFLNDTEISGVRIRLAESPVDTNSFPGETIALPGLILRNEGEKRRILPSPTPPTPHALRRRGQERAEAIKRFGYLQGHPINPLLAWPKKFGQPRAKRMADDLNYILKVAGIDYRFAWGLYETVEDLKRLVGNVYDSVLAVLPEGWRAPQREGDTHERIKQGIDVPSQCIQWDRTLPEVWVSLPHRETVKQDAKLARRIQQQYELCVWNLLAKLGWVPFAPLDPFHYNVHVGLDVGGRHNNRAMACLGHGFGSPKDGLLFRPEEIPINAMKAEPIPTPSLSSGLLRLFEQVQGELRDAGVQPDFDRALFFRDGRLLGDGDEWNELDALRTVHSELLRRGWVGAQSVWTAVEIMKNAEGWRVMSGGSDVSNPVVGRCVYPFDDPATALVCTTGSPYLTQGTAAPLKTRIVDVAGTAERPQVIRDLIWEADMCFTKPDMGMSLPWVLHVADAGALQTARSYRITGLTL